MTDELFRKVNDYINYSISNLGNVRNEKTGIIRKGSKNSDGYLVVGLYKNGIRKFFSIHRLMGIAFIENVNNCGEIDHVNRNKLDNRLENLRWVTRSQNTANRGKFKNSSSQFVGVYFNKSSKKWSSRISKDKIRTCLGYFLTEIEANDARQKYILDKNLQEFYN